MDLVEKKSRVAIVLPTYNGHAFVEKQISSIISQTYQNWQLYVRDDGSSDDTNSILKRFTESDDRIILIPSNHNLGVKKGVFFLLENVNADYYMTCDQDDFWLPEKIESTLNLMMSIEKNHNSPVLVHTDLVVVDSNLSEISHSMFQYQKLAKSYDNFFQLAIQNNITGCTVMINDSLKKMLKFDSHMLMHDHWMGLVASAYGEIGFLNKSTILYRQHGNNSVGAKKMNLANIVASRNEQIEKKKIITDSFIQVSSFLDNYYDSLSASQIEDINLFLSLPSVGLLKKISIIKKLKLKKSSYSRTLYYWFILFFKQKKINY